MTYFYKLALYTVSVVVSQQVYIRVCRCVQVCVGVCRCVQVCVGLCVCAGVCRYHNYRISCHHHLTSCVITLALHSIIRPFFIYIYIYIHTYICTLTGLFPLTLFLPNYYRDNSYIIPLKLVYTNNTFHVSPMKGKPWGGGGGYIP